MREEKKGAARSSRLREYRVHVSAAFLRRLNKEVSDIVRHGGGPACLLLLISSLSPPLWRSGARWRLAHTHILKVLGRGFLFRLGRRIFGAVGVLEKVAEIALAARGKSSSRVGPGAPAAP